MDYRIKKKLALATIATTLDLPPAASRKLDVRAGFLARAGFPDGAPSGRGFRGGYSLEQFWQLVLLFQLQRVGITLSQALMATRSSWPIASTAVTSAFSDFPLPIVWVAHMPVMTGMEDLVEVATPPTVLTIVLESDTCLQDALQAENVHHFCVLNATRIVQVARSQLKALPLGFDVDLAHQEWRTKVVAAARAGLARVR